MTRATVAHASGTTAGGRVPLLDSRQVARFVARGFLRFDAVVPDEINGAFMAEAGDVRHLEPGERVFAVYRDLMRDNAIPEVPAGTPLAQGYAQGSAIARMLDVPVIAGALASLLGPAPIFDHHFLHVTFPPRFYPSGTAPRSQDTHQDSTIDPRESRFDVQIMYFPHDVTADMGGTRFVPGTHLRRVSEAAIGRYQNVRGQQHVVCEAGTVLLMHHGIWHGGGFNGSDRVRYMFKIRLQASGDQVCCWNTADLLAPNASHDVQRPIFYLKSAPAADDVRTILTTPEPWFEADTGRLEYLNRIRLFRALLGDPSFDADYWLTRVENGA